jgi:hypothetical protein
MALQSGVLGLGAYLVIQGESTAGIIIASSIIAARALAPVEQTIAHWKHFVAARQSFARASRHLAMAPPEARHTALPKPFAARDMAAEGCRAAVLDCRHYLELAEADTAGMGLPPCRSMIAEDIRDLQSRARHKRLGVSRAAGPPST